MRHSAFAKAVYAINMSTHIEQELHDKYVDLLHSELMLALGCTEPVAIAFAAALARSFLSGEIKHIAVTVSPSIFKNAMGVFVPNAHGLKGVEASALLGAIGGDPSGGLEVLSTITDKDCEATQAVLNTGLCSVNLYESSELFHILVEMEGYNHSSLVEISGTHTSVVRIEVDGQVQPRSSKEVAPSEKAESFTTSFDDLFQCITTVDINRISALMKQQIATNEAIALEGLHGSWGSEIGKTLLHMHGSETQNYARALAAAGSDARMGGCSLPVMINSGSGNQGLTASLPVIVHARAMGKSEEQTWRALALSNLVAIHLKRSIGNLSAYCGVVSAAAGSAAALAYLHGESKRVIEEAVVNTLSNTSGIICDGAKASCAAKIATSIDAAHLGYELARTSKSFIPGEGITQKGIDQMTRAIGHLAREGMRETDQHILAIMMKNQSVTNVT